MHDVGDMEEVLPSLWSRSAQESMESRKLEPGMVLTIEPGLYFREKGLDQLHEIFQAGSGQHGDRPVH